MRRDEDRAPRATCWRCLKPAAACICARVPEVANRTPVFVLQHRHERGHPVGTARLARLGLADVEVRDAAGAVPRPALAPGAALLYPGPRARDLATLDVRERPSQLVVLDGTWRQARQLFRENPWLDELPHVRLAPDAPSRYRIRRQPAEHCVSTVESVVAALRMLEPDTRGLDGLLDAFDALVDAQKAYMDDPAATPRHQRRAPRPSRALPAVLREGRARVVVVYGETAPADPAVDPRRRRLVRWSAVRPEDGAVFDRLVRPEGAPPVPEHLAHMGLRPDDLAGATPLDAVAAGWRAFRRPDDVLVAWHPAVLRMLRRVDPRPGRLELLRALWSNLTHAKPGGLDALVAAEGLDAPPVAVRGRSGERLGRAVAVLDALVARAPRLARVREVASC